MLIGGMKGSKNHLLSLGMFALVCCSFSCSSALEKESYLEWVQDYENGLHVKKEAGEFIFDLQYMPDDYVWLQRQEGIDGDKEDREKTLQTYILTVSNRKHETDLVDYIGKSPEEKQRTLYYFSYLFQDDIYLEENGERLPCVLFHFEKPIDLKHSRTFVLGFENPAEDSEGNRLVIHSPKFNSLPVKINIVKKNIPALKL